MSTLFTLKIDGSDYDVNAPPSDSNAWLVVQEELYRPDKGKFVLDKFQSDYPSITVNDEEQIYSLASRSTMLAEWLAKTNIEYAVIEGAPTYFREYVDPSDFEKASDEVRRISLSLSEKAKAQEAAVQEYKNKLAKIDKEFSLKIKTDNKIAKVISLNSTLLPLSIQLAIDNYTPAAESTINQKTFGRECLMNFKIALLKALKKNPELDIDKIVKENQVK